MTQDFDKLISNSAPVVPDSGASRRMAQTLLHEKMRGQERRRQRRNRRGMSLAATVVFLLVIGGQATQLGSDGFDVVTRDLELDGLGGITISETGFRKDLTAFRPGTTQEVIDEVNQVYAAEEQVPFKLSGYQIEGKTFWMMEYHSLIKGGVDIQTGVPKNIIGHTMQPSKKVMTFLAEYSDEFTEDMEKNLIPRREYGLIQSNGRIYHVYMWTKEYAEYGPVTYYEGLAVD